MIVDLQLHDSDWKIDEATTFFERETHLPGPAAQQKAIRNSYDPTYNNYFLNKLATLKLHRDYQTARGATFDLREFHEHVMTNSIAP